MKILELRFKNLNSLYGEWAIDFTHPEYGLNGAFALIGPTGAGKSTILDAICLALYGCTPRLGKITTTNEIMSRQTGDCYAQVLFASQAGRFWCTWSQRRAGSKLTGNLQSQKHEIANADTNEVLESQIKNTLSTVIEKTGMDFERFTRSVLLAQGDFNAFLKASETEKSKILEQVTGTQIYSEISMRVHERQRSEKSELENLKATVSAITILTDYEEKEIAAGIAVKQIEEQSLSAQLTQTTAALNWLKALKVLDEEIQTITKASEKLRGELEQFAPQEKHLERAQQAALLDGEYAQLRILRKQQVNNNTQLKTFRDSLPALENVADVCKKEWAAAQQNILDEKRIEKNTLPLIQKTLLLDQNIAEQNKLYTVQVQQITKERESIEQDTKKSTAASQKQAKLKEQLKEIKQYLADNDKLKNLRNEFAAIKLQCDTLSELWSDGLGKQDQLKKMKLSVEKQNTNLKKREEEHKKSAQAYEEAVKTLHESETALQAMLAGKLLREYRDEKDYLLREMAYVNKIIQLEKEREQLEQGKPCPLCGATMHPFAEGNTPKPDATEQKIKELTNFIEKADLHEKRIENLKKTELAAQKLLTESDKQRVIAENAYKVDLSAHNSAKEELERLSGIFTKRKQEVLERLTPFGITQLSENNMEALLKPLSDALKKWEEYLENQNRIEKEIAKLNHEIESLQAVILTKNTALDEKKQHMEQLKTNLEAAKAERVQLFGDKNPKQEEKRLLETIQKAEKNELDARNKQIATQEKLTIANTSIADLQKSIACLEVELTQAENNFINALGTQKFSDEKTFLDAQLLPEERDSLARKGKELENAKTELETRLKDSTQRHAQESEKNLTQNSIEELHTQLREKEEVQKQTLEYIALSKNKLTANAEAKEQRKENVRVIEAKEKECLRWDALHSLIGSADGKKFRNFAQGLAFELMVTHANRQLEKMTDRYLLVRDTEKSLELNVIDSYQAGEVRSIKNLSGGECFIVSLALALGLSKMSSKNMRVDSLFLDEGFGTLDEDALDTALTTLSGLQQGGKLIGVISHVSALKHRISTQINVSPTSAGRSTLSGPGCEKVLREKA